MSTTIDMRVVRGHHTLFENGHLEKLDPQLIQTTVVQDGRRAGEEYNKFLAAGARFQPVLPDGKQVIDCRKPSWPPEWKMAGDWKIAFHRPLGSTIWRPEDATLWMPEEQRTGGIKGRKLLELIKKENTPVLPDPILDYLVANPHEIPEQWAEGIKAHRYWPYFCGTVYGDPDGCLYVRYLGWSGERFYAGYNLLDSVFYVCHPAASLAS